MAHSLDQIVDLLSRNRQRATYAAVAELTGANPRKLMGGRPKDHPNSWVVAEKDGRPTGYGPEEVDPALIVRMPSSSKRLTLILLANSPGLAQGYNLENANVTSSPFVKVFLRLFI